MYSVAPTPHLRRIHYLHGIYPTNVTLFSPYYRTKTGAVRYRKP
jgi:hypothetical protein